MWIAVLGYLASSEGGELATGHFVLHVKVGGNDKQAVIAQLPEGAVEHMAPQGGVVPIILMAHEGQIEPLAAGHGSKEALAVFDVEAGLDVVILGGSPPLAGGFNFSRADVGAHDFKAGRPIAENVSQYSGFVCSSAGEIEDTLLRACLTRVGNSVESGA